MLKGVYKDKPKPPQKGNKGTTGHPKGHPLPFNGLLSAKCNTKKQAGGPTDGSRGALGFRVQGLGFRV